MVTIVRMLLSQLENRFSRSQPSGPMVPTGGLRIDWTSLLSAIAQRSTSWMRRLYQFMISEVASEVVR